MFDLLKKIAFKNEVILNVRVIRTKKRIKSTLTRIRNGSPEIICPFFSSQKYLEKIIKKNQKWIARELSDYNKKKEYLRKLADGKHIFLFGKKLNIQVQLNDQNKIEIKKNNIFISSVEKDFKVVDFLKRWLKDYADKYLFERTKDLSKKTKIKIKNLKIKNYKARWGCCNRKSEIILNWKLVMLPKEIIDYVIIHELSHILEPNHSASFWSIVKSFDPNYKDKDKWLKKNGNPIILF